MALLFDSKNNRKEMLLPCSLILGLSPLFQLLQSFIRVNGLGSTEWVAFGSPWCIGRLSTASRARLQMETWTFARSFSVAAYNLSLAFSFIWANVLTLLPEMLTKVATLGEGAARPRSVARTVLETAFSVTALSAVFAIAEPAAITLSVSKTVPASWLAGFRAGRFKGSGATPARGLGTIGDAISAFLGYNRGKR